MHQSPPAHFTLFPTGRPSTYNHTTQIVTGKYPPPQPQRKEKKRKMAPPIPFQDRPGAFLTDFNQTFENEDLIVEALRLAGCFGSAGNKELALIGDTILRLYLQVEGRARGKNRGMQS